MERRIIALAIVVVAAIAVLAGLSPRDAGGEEHYTVVVTFASLEDDVAQLLCPDDRIAYIAPPGVDPHTYQLTVDDRRILENAEIIVSTGHTPFEQGIREMVDNGELDAVLVEIPSIPGIRLYANPVTGQPNLHMPIYDPGNYLVFMSYLKDLLVQVNPDCKSDYVLAYEEIAERVENITDTAPSLEGVSAVGATPVVQYAVEWLDVDVSTLLVKEHDAPLTSEDIQRVESVLSSGQADMIVVQDQAPPQLMEKVEELSSRYGVPVLVVPSPASPGTIPDKLETVVSGVEEIVG